MARLGIIHTSFALVEPLNTLAKEMLPESVDIVNVVDDTLLSYARQHGVDSKLKRRMYTYFQSAVWAGADVILNACSSVGETVDAARELIDVPILKIDEPMAEAAVAAGKRVAVHATVASTLGPTVRLLRAKAKEAGKEIEISERLCDGAFDLLVCGQTEQHDEAVSKDVLESAADHDVIVFAQASMARLVPMLEGKVSVPLLSSPKLAMGRLNEMLRDV